jgi:hypothetical protein
MNPVPREPAPGLSAATVWRAIVVGLCVFWGGVIAVIGAVVGAW